MARDRTLALADLPRSTSRLAYTIVAKTADESSSLRRRPMNLLTITLCRDAAEHAERARNLPPYHYLPDA